MNLPKGVLLIICMFVILLVPLRVLSTVYSDQLQQNLQDKAFACLTDVYPLNLTHYNITRGAFYDLPSAPSDTFTTQAVDYFLNSPDSNLVANFLFKDAVLYSLSLSVINGSVVLARPNDNLTDVVIDFLLKYQAFSSADSTDLIRLLDNFDENKNTTLTLGNISLRISHLLIPNLENVTTFHWIYTLNDSDDTSVSLSFDNSTFVGFFDSRQLYAVASTEAVSRAINYVENYSCITPDGSHIKGFNVDKGHSFAEFFISIQDGTICPCWNVTLNLSNVCTESIKALQMEVWANSGEVANCRNQNSAPQVSNPNMSTLMIAMVTVAVAALTIAVGIIFIRRGK